MEFAVAAANRTLFAVIGRTAQYLYIALACKDLYNVMVGKMIMSLLEPLSQQDYKALYVVIFLTLVMKPTHRRRMYPMLLLMM